MIFSVWKFWQSELSANLDTMLIRIPDALLTIILSTKIHLLRQFAFDNLPTASIRLPQIFIFTKFIASLA